MANTPQSRKRARQADVRRVRNHSQRSAMRTSIKKLLKAVQAGDKEQAAELYRSASSLIDRTARKGLQHKNKASRLKSRLSARVKAISA